MKNLLGRSSLLALLAFLLVVSACNDNNNVSQNSYDPFPNFLVPHAVRCYLEPNDELSQTQFSIDQLNQKIFNSTPLSYGFKLDSAYLQMSLSTRCSVVVKNLKTGKEQSWELDKKRKYPKLDVQGGKLELRISYDFNKDLDPVVYEMDINVYDYDPNKITWEKSKTGLPIAFGDARFIKRGNKTYLFADSKESFQSYEVRSFEPLQLDLLYSKASERPVPHTLRQDEAGALWALTKDGALLYSSDFMQWKKIDADGITFTALLYDNEIDASKSRVMVAVGMDATQAYHLYQMSPSGLVKTEPLQEQSFPVRDMLVHVYERAGVRHANIIGGTAADGTALENSYFFTDNGFSYGNISYRTRTFAAPKRAATLFDYKSKLYLVGGIYNTSTSDSSPIYLSVDRGASWVPMGQKQGPDQSFDLRLNPAAIVVDEGEYPSFYILGGLTKDGQFSNSYWRGYVKNE